MDFFLVNSERKKRQIFLKKEFKKKKSEFFTVALNPLPYLPDSELKSKTDIWHFIVLLLISVEKLRIPKIKSNKETHCKQQDVHATYFTSTLDKNAKLFLTQNL